LKRYNDPQRVAAVDLGAESGRVTVGEYSGDYLALDVVHRFANRPVHGSDGLHWNVQGLFGETVAGLRKAGEVGGVGIDTWGCDYALLDEDGVALGAPFHHRDARTETMPARAFDIVSKDELYLRTGTQHLRFNTVFQLLADVEQGVELERADRIALIPDLINYWLTGVLVNEATVASTTGLTDVSTRTWERALVERFGLPARPFRHELTEPGETIGPVDGRFRFDPAPLVRTVACHDTASAFVAAPLTSANAGLISCGTWSLVGLELRDSCFGVDAAAANLSNEGGIDGTTRLLRNVMGLWILQECRRQWERESAEPVDYQELQLLAGAISRDVPVFDPDLDLFLEPGDMPARIAAVCREAGQEQPEGRAELVRSILLSLACAYRSVFDELARVRGHAIDRVHILGGGSLNEVLCRLTADVLGVPVIAGPVEAAAIGNILVQLRAAGIIESLEEMRACVNRSFAPMVYEPAGGSTDYERYQSVIGTRDRIRSRA
jgi:rhamnulokinase